MTAPIEQRRFSVVLREALIEIGDHAYLVHLSWDDNGNRELTPLLGEQNDLFAEIKQRALLFTVRVTDGLSVGNVERNTLINPPPGWDINGDRDATEIVNERGLPVLQVIYVSDARAIVRGVFQMRGTGVSFFSQSGAWQEDPPNWQRWYKDWPLNPPLFRYPSSAHLGVRIR